MLLPLQEATVTSPTCKCVYMAWAGSAGMQESLELTTSCSTAAHPCWLALPWNTSLEMWGEIDSRWWLEEHTCPLGMGKGSF